MFTRTIFTFALVAIVFAGASNARAQTTDLSQIITRMNAIISEMNALQTEFKSLAASLQSGSPTPVVLGAQISASTVFTESLEQGATNDDIKRIQTLLATDSEIYPYGVASGFFGPKTEEAIRNLQTRFGLDAVGVIGPATKALLEGYFRAYANGSYPDGVLSTKPPAVLGASTATSNSSDRLATLQSKLSTLTSGSGNNDNPADKISGKFDDGETWVTIKYNDGTPTMRIVADTEDKEDVMDYVVSKTKLSKSQVEELITYKGSKSSSKSSDADEGDAEDAIDDADAVIDEVRDEISEADEDGEKVSWAEDTWNEAKDLYRDAKEAFKEEDWDEAVELAEEAEELAEEAEDQIGKKEGESADDIEEIIAYVGDDEAEIEVEFADDDDSFTVKTEDEDEIIEEVADELGIDEDEVEDLIEFRGKKVESIDVEIDDDESYVHIEFEDGSDKDYSLDETDEDDIIERLAKKLKLTEKEVERAIEFD